MKYLKGLRPTPSMVVSIIALIDFVRGWCICRGDDHRQRHRQ